MPRALSEVTQHEHEQVKKREAAVPGSISYLTFARAQVRIVTLLFCLVV